MNLSKKLIMLSIIPTILFTLISCFYIIPNAKKSIYLEKDIQIRYNVENAYSIVGYYYSLAEKGVMPVAAAQATAKETISKMRYGQDGYFWIDNTNFVNLMHGTRPETVGENRKETKDVKGTYMVKEYIEGAIQHKAEGYFSDFWFPKPNETEASPKRGYAKFFEPWGWIVATGDQTLFVRNDAVELAWEVFMPVLESWEKRPDVNALRQYETGSWGPVEAEQLLAQDGNKWR